MVKLVTLSHPNSIKEGPRPKTLNQSLGYKFLGVSLSTPFGLCLSYQESSAWCTFKGWAPPRRYRWPRVGGPSLSPSETSRSYWLSAIDSGGAGITGSSCKVKGKGRRLPVKIICVSEKFGFGSLKFKFCTYLKNPFLAPRGAQGLILRCAWVCSKVHYKGP